MINFIFYINSIKFFFDFIISEAAEMGWFSSIDQAVPSVVFARSFWSRLALTSSLPTHRNWLETTASQDGGSLFILQGYYIHLQTFIYTYIHTSFSLCSRDKFLILGMAKKSHHLRCVFYFMSSDTPKQSRCVSFWFDLPLFLPIHPSFRVRVVFIWWTRVRDACLLAYNHWRKEFKDC